MKKSSFEKESKTYLLRKNIIIKRPNDKLDFKKLGLFIIAYKISEFNYKLSLSKTIQIHFIFYIFLFEPTSKLTKEQKEKIKITSYQKYKVETIFNKRR